MESKLADNLVEKINRFAPSLFGEIEAKEKAETLKARKEKASELVSIQAETEKAVKALLPEQDEAEEAIKAAEAALLEKKKAWSAVKRKIWSTSHQGQTQADALSRYLHETAPVEIDQAIEHFQKKLSWLREDGRIRSDMTGSVKNLFLWTQKTKAESNRNAVLSAMRYCQDAIETLGKMKLDAELDQKGIEKLKSGIPDAGEYTLIEGEKPMESMAAR